MALDKRLKIGCGVGCGVVAFVALLILGGAIWYAKDMAKNFKVVEETEEALFEATGGFDRYVLPPGGVPGPDRLDAFLVIRAGLSEWQVNLKAAIAKFQAKMDTDDESLSQTLGLLRAGSDLAPVFAGFWSARNRALLEQDMGPAEYLYLYALGYYAYLGYEPDDGHASGLEMQGRASFGFGDDESASALAEGRSGDIIVAQLRRVIMPRLERLTPDSAADEERASQLTREQIDLELSRLSADPSRWPWRSDLPLVLADAFRPHRKTLEETYDVSINPVELMFDTEP